jgi:hypothetical protein
LERAPPGRVPLGDLDRFVVSAYRSMMPGPSGGFALRVSTFVTSQSGSGSAKRAVLSFQGDRRREGDPIVRGELLEPQVAGHLAHLGGQVAVRLEEATAALPALLRRVESVIQQAVGGMVWRQLGQRLSHRALRGFKRHQRHVPSVSVLVACLFRIDKVAAEVVSRRFPEADDGVRTRDPQLGKLMLYQLSYVRVPKRVPHPRSNRG